MRQRLVAVLGLIVHKFRLVLGVHLAELGHEILHDHGLGDPGDGQGDLFHGRLALEEEEDPVGAAVHGAEDARQGFPVQAGQGDGAAAGEAHSFKPQELHERLLAEVPAVEGGVVVGHQVIAPFLAGEKLGALQRLRHGA